MFKRIFKIILLFLAIQSCTYTEIKKDNCIDNKCIISTEIKTEIETVVKSLDDETQLKDIVFYTAIWCDVCKAQYEYLQEIYDRHDGNVNFSVIVAEDDTTKEELEKFLIEKEYKFDVYFDYDFKFANKYNIYQYTTILEKNKKNEYEIKDYYSYNLNQYNKKYENQIDVEIREKLKNKKVYNINDDEIEILDVVSSNSIIFYGAPWCPDCVKEIDRLSAIKGKRKLIYLIDGRRYSFDSYKQYVENSNKNMEIYYLKDTEIKNEFNIKWLPSVTEVKNSKFTGTFIRNDKYLIK